MKENFIPTKDLKTGVKVTATVVGSVFEAVKPELKRAVGNQARNILKTFSKNK